jgi:hypothetical protein
VVVGRPRRRDLRPLKIEPPSARTSSQRLDVGPAMRTRQGWEEGALPVQQSQRNCPWGKRAGAAQTPWRCSSSYAEPPARRVPLICAPIPSATSRALVVRRYTPKTPGGALVRRAWTRVLAPASRDEGALLRESRGSMDRVVGPLWARERSRTAGKEPLAGRSSPNSSFSSRSKGSTSSPGAARIWLGSPTRSAPGRYGRFREGACG